MNAEKPSLPIALKTLWGAADMPFGDACPEPYRHPSFEELTRRLQQLCDIGANGLLHGPNGIGNARVHPGKPCAGRIDWSDSCHGVTFRAVKSGLLSCRPRLLRRCVL